MNLPHNQFLTVCRTSHTHKAAHSFTCIVEKQSAPPYEQQTNRRVADVNDTTDATYKLGHIGWFCSRNCVSSLRLCAQFALYQKWHRIVFLVFMKFAAAAEHFHHTSVKLMGKQDNYAEAIKKFAPGLVLEIASVSFQAQGISPFVSKL